MATVLDRNGRIRVYVAGGAAGGIMGKPVDITMDKIPNDSFERTKKIVRLLTAKKEELTPEEIEERNQSNNVVGNFGYYVEVGKNDDPHDKLHHIFNNHFRATPLIVTELQTILKEHTTPEDLVLKP